MDVDSATNIEDVVDVIIIGSGISGMTVAIDMLRLNDKRRFLILEKGHRVGGTWSDNEYPGCCCDVWSHLYSLSFCPNPDWSREYPTQPEIQRYLASVARTYNLEKHIVFETIVESCVFDLDTGIWTTTICRVKDGSTGTFRSRFVVSAVGQLNQPAYPKLSGMNKFQGAIMHSARWDKTMDLRGKTVAVIGNGATAIQIVPQLTKIAKQVVVFQRSPNYITPRQDTAISPLRRIVYRYVPWIRRQYRAGLMDTREAFWQVLVDVGGEAHQAVKQISAELLHDQLPGDDRIELREVLTPRYPPGCKRILISDDYYPALGESHVILETAAITQVTETGIQVSSGWNSQQGAHELQEHAFDVIVCATGFQATQFLSPMCIEIKGGDSLPRKWEEGAYAYKGLMVPGIYNFAMMYGPNTNLGHNSIILMIEAQSAYINRLIHAVCANHGPSQGSYLRISPRESTTRAFNAKLQESLGRSTLASDQCSSWYKSETGVITTNWSGNVVEYQCQLSTLEWQDYELEGPGAQKLRSQEQVKWARVVEESRPWVSGLVNLSSVGLLLGIGSAAVLAIISKGRLLS
ncbi:hypothetical protein LTR17_008869 [Elasticomyces elasticus]|nr:hypothetical protein LTR17_008869 [Elasticomyces elasticus]